MNKPEDLISLIKSYEDGKVIQYRFKGITGEWNDWTDSTNFDFGNYEYRVKKEVHYGPYESAMQFITAQHEHGPYIKIDDDFVLPVTVNDMNITCSAGLISFRTLVHTAKWQDNSACGRAVKE